MLNETTEYILNFGPHHPSTHGVLRLILKLSGETIKSCDPDIGYLHRGVEKIVESKKFLSIIPYIDRLDYLSPTIQEHAYVLGIENVLNIKVPKRALLIRVIFDELTRISSHIMGIGTMTFDLGCLSLHLYGFEEREKIMDIFEATTGARMHLAYYIPGGVLDDISNNSLNSIKEFLNNLDIYLKYVEKLALDNRIFQKRTKQIGIISKHLATKSGISGVNLRASGVEYDIRSSKSYGAYKLLNFKPITLNDGDSYSRMLLRYLEIKQSINLIREAIDLLEPGEICNNAFFKRPLNRNNLEELSNAFFFSKGIELPSNTIIYSSTETPRGEFGIHLFTEKDKTKPYRLRLKSPSFASIQLLKTLLIDVNISDITAILGSLDFIMGCCDR